jgi:hypothetical protein
VQDLVRALMLMADVTRPRAAAPPAARHVARKGARQPAGKSARRPASKAPGRGPRR